MTCYICNKQGPGQDSEKGPCGGKGGAFGAGMTRKSLFAAGQPCPVPDGLRGNPRLTGAPFVRHPRGRHGEPRDPFDPSDRNGGGARAWLVLVADFRTGGAWLAMVTLLQDSH